MRSFTEHENDTLLYEGKFFSLMSRRHAFGEHEFVHQAFTDGVSVAALPFIKSDSINSLKLVLIDEIRVPWNPDETNTAAITGIYDDTSITHAETAAKEIHEEAGIRVDASALIDLDITWDSKITDTVIYLFAVDVTDLPMENLDNMERESLEIDTYPRIIPEEHIHNINDPLVAQMYVRLKHKLWT